MRELDKFLKFQYAITHDWIHLSYVVKGEQTFYGEPNTKERCKKDWVVAGGSVLFEDDKDAMLFKFRFSKFE